MARHEKEKTTEKKTTTTKKTTDQPGKGKSADDKPDDGHDEEQGEDSEE